MIAAILLCLLASPNDAFSTLPVAVLTADGEVDAAIEAAGENVAKLVKLAAGYLEASNSNAAEQVYQRVIELDPDHEVARAGLRHQFYDGQWFESYVALAKYKRKQAASMKKKGLALWNEEWVPIDDVPFLSLGWKRNTAGKWVDPYLEERSKQVAVWKAAGYEFRPDDNSWVAPDELQNWTNLLWKCDDKWLSLEEANQFHASVQQSWELSGEHFITWTSAPWETGNLARWHADQVHPHLLRIFGVEPKEKPHFFVLPSLAAYNDAAGGTNTIPDVMGFSSLHGAYFAELCFDESTDPPHFIGMGACYWDRSDPAVDAWGPFWTRWAAAQSYVDAIDRSWLAISSWIAEKGRGEIGPYGEAFWGEKRIPRWLRYGAASYVARFLPDPQAAEGVSPWGLRTFALEELKKAGGLRDLKDVFAFKLSLDDAPGSSRLYHEAGLVVAYLLDGAEDDTELAAAHEAFRSALASDSKDEVAATVSALEKLLLKKKKQIRAFAGL